MNNLVKQFNEQISALEKYLDGMTKKELIKYCTGLITGINARGIK